MKWLPVSSARSFREAARQQQLAEPLAAEATAVARLAPQTAARRGRGDRDLLPDGLPLESAGTA
jgi:hypothetical protein